MRKMELKGNTSPNASHASFVIKDTVAEVKINSSTEPSNNSLDNTINSQKHGAECSSTIYINDEKDDLLEKIEELCSDKSENIRNSENIYKSSEREFLRKIEEIEKNENKVSDLSNDKPNTNAELKAKQILECEATTIDSIIIGDKVLEVKDDSSREIDDPPIIVTSSDEIEKTVIAESVEPINENSLPPSGKEITASLSILKSDESKHDLTNDKIECPQANSLIHEEQMETLQNIEQKNPTEENLETNRISLEVNEANKVDVGKSLAKQYIEKSNKTKNHQPYDADENSGKNEKIEKKGIEEVNITGNAKKDETFNEICYEDIKSTNADNKVTVVPCNNNEKVHEISTTESHQNENKTIGAKLKENIVSCNLSNTEVSSSNMFYNTSIEKKIDMSENISEVSDALQLNFINKDEEDSEKLSNIKSENSTTEAEACDTSEIKQHSPDDATQQSVDGLKTYNGIPDTTMVEQDIKDKLNINKNMETDDCSITDLKNKFTYEVNVYSEQNDLRYLSIERVSSSCSEKKLDINKSSPSENSMQSTSNDSVNSSAVITDMQALNTATPASTSFRSLTSKIKHNILGIEELCNFMINEFTKIKHANLSESPKLTTVLETSKMSTPISQSKKSKMTRSYAEIPSTSASKLKHVRKRSIQEDDFDISPKVKHAKRDLSKETQKPDTIPEKESITVRPCVLAKWVDKKFYAGKITAEKPGNKYVVLFEDGASKTLPKESIVFGEGDVLPLQDQQVYALIDEDYESGTVLSIENVNNKTLYCIKTDRTTVKVTSSDIYLEVDQAKEIQKLQNLKVGDGIEEDESLGPRPSRNKRPPVSPSTPEGGYTGAAGKRGGKRQKRYS